jgi:hypothetical protein
MDVIKNVRLISICQNRISLFAKSDIATMLLSEKILMIEPRGFTFNRETTGDNYFQSREHVKAPVETAMKEFHDLKFKLMRAGIEVSVYSPTDDTTTPDSVFPNNWFSTTPYGQLILYPMMAPNRRLERRKDIIEKVKQKYTSFIDLSNLEEKKFFLEGTGSLVMDHENKVAYASLSKRTSEEALKEWKKQMEYEVVMFTSIDKNKEVIYHTNVVMALGDGFAIVCLEAIENEKERKVIRERLAANNELIEITLEQVHNFCGNCLMLKNSDGEKFIVMSSKAFNAFTEQQKNRMIRYATIIHSGLTTIETLGGGSARCMMAELF